MASDEWITTMVPSVADAGAWVTVPPPEPAAPPTDWGQGAADVARVGANTLTLGQWDRARAGLRALGSDTYAGALAEETAKSREAGERLHPFIRGSAQAVGGIPLGLGVGGLTRKVVGDVARPLWQRGVIGAVEGAGIGAAEGAGHTYTGDPSDYLRNATMGGVFGGMIGGAAPVVSSAGSTAGRWMADKGWFGGPTGNVARAAQVDPAGLRAIASTPGAMLADAPAMTALAQGAVPGTTGPGKHDLVQALRERQRTQASRITGDIDRTFGPAPIPSHVEAGVRERMQDLGPDYDAVFARARAIDTTPVNDFLTNQISTTRGPAQAAMRQVREMLQLPDAPPGTLDPHPRSLQSARRAVRGMQEATDDPEVRGQLGRVYDRLTDELHRKVPGIRQLDAQYAELGSQERAIQPASQGARVFQVDRENVARPIEMQETLREAAQPKGGNVGPSAEAFRLSQAARGELDRIVGTNRHDLAALERILGQPSDWNAQKLAIVFGPGRAQRMFDLLQRERMFSKTHQDVVEGSQTAARLAAKESQEAAKGNIPVDATLTGMLLRGGQGAVRSMRRGVAESNRDAIAGLMATRDPVRLRAEITRLLAAEPNRNRREAIWNEMLRRGITGAGVGYATGGQ